MAEERERKDQNKQNTPPPKGNGGLGGPMNNDPKKGKFNSFLVPMLLIFALLMMYFLGSNNEVKDVDWPTFRDEMLLIGDVSKLVVVNDQFTEVYIRKERLEDPKYKEIQSKGFGGMDYSGPHYKLKIGEERLHDYLNDAQKDLPEEDKIYPETDIRQDYLRDVISWLVPLGIIIVIWLFVFRRMSGGAGGAGGPGNIFNVGKSKAKIFDKDTNVKVNFKDVAGLEEAKTEIKEIVDFLKQPKKYTELGGKIPKGALLVGPPGTGKTLLAKAVAGEANVPFFSMSGSDFVEMFVGVGASRVRDLFKQAKEKAPCIIFIDEIDAIGRARGRNANFGANDERENTLNQLLTEMDGFGSNLGVILLAATNRADVLDRALLRAGRFDRQIHVELPDLNERQEIFKVHLRPLKLEEGLDVSFLAKQTPGFSGADIANVCNEAALIAARKDKKTVQKQDFLDSIDRIIGGLERKNKIITYKEKETIAYHEAGHATVSWMLEHANPLVKVTIIPRGKALGAAWYLPEERQITTKEQLLDEICSTLGGRASEEIIFEHLSTGALNDLERVTKQAYAMVSYYGLSDAVGNRSYYDSTGQSEYNFTKPYSEQTAKLIDDESQKIIVEQYDRAKEILKENKEGLQKLAKLLLEREVIFSEDLIEIFGPRPWKTREEEHAEYNAMKNQQNGDNVSDDIVKEASKEPSQDENKIQEN